MGVQTRMAQGRTADSLAVKAESHQSVVQKRTFSTSLSEIGPLSVPMGSRLLLSEPFPVEEGTP